jgi:hypothetical protein
VSQVKRWKDADGKYYCDTCWARSQVKRQRPGSEPSLDALEQKQPTDVLAKIARHLGRVATFVAKNPRVILFVVLGILICVLIVVVGVTIRSAMSDSQPEMGSALLMAATLIALATGAWFIFGLVKIAQGKADVYALLHVQMPAQSRSPQLARATCGSRVAGNQRPSERVSRPPQFAVDLKSELRWGLLIAIVALGIFIWKNLSADRKIAITASINSRLNGARTDSHAGPEQQQFDEQNRADAASAAAAKAEQEAQARHNVEREEQARRETAAQSEAERRKSIQPAINALIEYGMAKVNLDGLEQYAKAQADYSQALAQSMSASGRLDWGKLNKAMDDATNALDEAHKARGYAIQCLEKLKTFDQRILATATQEVVNDQSVDIQVRAAIRKHIR